MQSRCVLWAASGWRPYISAETCSSQLIEQYLSQESCASDFGRNSLKTEKQPKTAAKKAKFKTAR